MVKQSRNNSSYDLIRRTVFIIKNYKLTTLQEIIQLVINEDYDYSLRTPSKSGAHIKQPILTLQGM